ncbi:MAG: sterol desaturase family protein [Myxococcota bacterium]
MGKLSPIAYAIPFFFLLIGVEALVARRLHRRVYRLNDALADLGTGVLQQVFGLALKLVIGGAYLALYERAAITHLPEDKVWVWVASFVGVDFFYYWFHRLSHQINFLWAAHVVHHQSDEYNLAVALRQSALQPGFSWVFYLPLAILGFSPTMVFITISFNTLYQFWIHTRLIDRLGPLELLLNTPSHHRVHHGRNPQYIDRNHAGMLIIWDKLFGTFEPEGEEVIYGITRPLRSWDALWANIHPWRDLVVRTQRTPRALDKFKLWFMKPGWAGQGTPDEAPGYYARLDDPKFDPPVDRASLRLATYRFVIMTATSLFLIAGLIDGMAAIALGLLTAVDALSIGALLEGKAWMPRVELARLSALGLFAGAAWAWALLPAAGAAALLAVALLSTILLRVWRARIKSAAVDSPAIGNTTTV